MGWISSEPELARENLPWLKIITTWRDASGELHNYSYRWNIKFKKYCKKHVWKTLQQSLMHICHWIKDSFSLQSPKTWCNLGLCCKGKLTLFLALLILTDNIFVTNKSIQNLWNRWVILHKCVKFYSRYSTQQNIFLLKFHYITLLCTAVLLSLVSKYFK